MSKTINLYITHDEHGYALQLFSPDESRGVVAVTPKPKSTYKRPLFVFENVDSEYLCKLIMEYALEKE